MNSIVRQIFPSYFPTITNDSIGKWVEEMEQLFKQPVKQVFPYPIDAKRVYSNSTGKLIKLVFDVALAGIEKDWIKVQLKKEKFLTISIDPIIEETNPEEDVEYVYSSKTLAYRRGEITFKLFNEIDIDKFKPTFKNGLLEIELYLKEQVKDDSDIIDAPIISE